MDRKHHVLREQTFADETNPVDSSLSVTVFSDDIIEIYTWRFNYGSISSVELSRKEAVALAKIINEAFPLDVLGGSL